jgi:hypothetical protein
MAHLIQAEDLSNAWLQAQDYLVSCDGKAINLNVAFEGGREDKRIRDLPDEFLADLDATRDEKDVWPIQTVANTIFPDALYHPHLGAEAAPRLYENYELSMRLQRQSKSQYDRETYFNRLIAYPTADGPWNQLDFHVRRLRKQATLASQASSVYELGLSHPVDAELRLQAPGTDKRMYWFPCLSHISLTLIRGQLNMTAVYRNQTFITRAYGNYLGLARLLDFLANETSTTAGEIEVVASHADADLALGQRAINDLLLRCHAALGAELVEVSARG